MNLFAISSLLCGVFCFLLALFSFITGKSSIYRLVGWYNIAVSIWGFGGFIVASSLNETQALMGWKIAHFGGFFVGALFYHLTLVLCEVSKPKLLFWAYFQGVFYNLINLPTDLMMKPIRVAFGFHYIDRTFFSSAAFCTYALLILLSYLELAKYLKSAQGYKKERVWHVFYGFLFGFVGGTSVLLPEFRIDILYPAGNIGVFIYASIVTYTILRNKILDLEEFVKAAHKDKLATIGTLATSLNHEVKNPLYIIRSLAETYLEKRKEGLYQNDEQALQKSGEILTKTVAQANRAMEIMKRFTLFAKQSINEKAQLELIYIGNILDDVVPLIHHELELDKIHLIRDIPADLSPIKADRRHMEEIFFNLVVNSCQAIKNESRAGEIKISAEQRNGHVKVVIEDDGPGIPTSNLKQIFEPFFTTKGKEGTGLGLYITKQLIERNEGKIHVKSEVGKGTSFVLEFKR